MQMEKHSGHKRGTALINDRFGLIDRETAGVASSVWQDFGIMTDNDYTHIEKKT